MKKIMLAITLILTFGSLNAQDALMRAQERAKYLNDYKALLQHDDPVMRMAALEEAMLGDDPQLRSMALENALAGDDERLQTAALREYVNAREQITMTFLLPERASDAQKHIYSSWNGTMINKPEVTPSDEITFKSRFGTAGQLIRGGLEFNFNGGGNGICKLTARSAGGTALAGQFHCTFSGGHEQRVGATEAAVPIRIDLS